MGYPRELAQRALELVGVEDSLGILVELVLAMGTAIVLTVVFK
jgi:hypothetical protein